MKLGVVLRFMLYGHGRIESRLMIRSVQKRLAAGEHYTVVCMRCDIEDAIVLIGSIGQTDFVENGKGFLEFLLFAV